MKFEPLLKAKKEWGGSIAPLSVWQENGRYHMIYEISSGQSYAVSNDAYNWTRPDLNQVEYNGSKKNNLIFSSAKGATDTFEDPSAAPEERFKGWVLKCTGATRTRVRSWRERRLPDG